jgi:uridine kinase
VIANRYANFLPLFAKIDMMLRDGPVILAIEGGSASGKSTLAEALREIYGCGVIHTDDFFLRPEQRTAERLSEVGGNLDRERFMDEVLPSLTRGEAVQYRPFDCGTQTLLPPVTVENNRLTVVEGVYATHPAFGTYYDLAVFLDISSEQQRARIVKRNPPFLAERFFGEWIPLENQYFEGTAIRDRVDLCIPVWEE